MDFLQNEGQRELAALSRDILRDWCTPERLREVEAGGDRFDPGLWAELARAGILAATLPEDLDGSGLGLLEQCSVLTEIGRAVAPAPFLASIVLGAGALAAFGTPAQQEFAARAGRGDIVLTAALAEEDGDDPRAPVVSAERTKGVGAGDAGWRLTGVKTAVPAAPRAGLFLVPAATAAGTVVFLVAPDDPGVTLEPQQLVDTDTAGRLELAGAEVPAGRVLGGPAAGARITDWLLARATVGLCAQQLGILERALELTADYAKDRVAFGRPIGSFQAVTQRLADASIDVEAVRLTMWQAAWRLLSGLPAETEIATAKFWAAEAGHRVAHTAVHIHGGVGIDIGYPVHRYFTAAKRAEFELGGATAQLLRIGAALARAD
ncbi:MAG TPA: acyl-CoA dehydrogenase family protein [Streptosporangiaceae bacterium]|jgi:acyl-CoA dehydrogenase|nr:acyl-CoA dehydrogenase family protein [Streptosporangiaceae bacterium]